MGIDQQRAKDRPGAEAAMKRRRLLAASPLWSCGNCKAFETAYDGDGTCKDAGIKETDQPCAISKKWHGGEFDPIGLGDKLEALNFHELDVGEVALLRFLCDWRTEELMYQPRPELTVGLKVVAKFGGQLRPGVITGLADGLVAITTDGGVPIKTYPGNVEVAAE